MKLYHISTFVYSRRFVWLSSSVWSTWSDFGQQAVGPNTWVFVDGLGSCGNQYVS